MEIEHSPSTATSKLLEGGPSKVFDYDPYRCPPEIALSKDHLSALRIAKPVQTKHKINIDEVSGFPVDNTLLPLCCDPEDLSFVSPAYPMFFQFVKFCMIITILIFLPAGLYGIARNLDGQNCTTQNPEAIVSCFASFQTKTSLANISGDDNDDLISDLFVFLTIFMLIVALQYMRKNQRIVAIECDERALTASDFSIKISNFPRNFEDSNVDVDDAVKKFVHKHALPGRLLNVKKVSVIYNCTDKLKLRAQVKEKAIEKAKLLAKKALTADVLDAEIDQLSDQITSLEIEINKISEKFKEGKGVLGLFTGEAFVSFETQQEAEAVVEHWDIGFLKYLFNKIHWNSQYKYKGNMIKIIRAAEPSDVVWENAGFTTSEKYWRRVAGVIFAFFVLMVFFGIITVLSHYQTTALKSNTSPFGPFLNGLVSFAVVVLNYALCFIMKKISLFEKHTTYTEQFLSYSQKLAAAQFLNTSVLTILLTMTSDPVNWAGQGGLVTNIFNIFVINALMSWFMGAIYIWYYLADWKRKKVLKNNAEGMVQVDLNKVFENPVFDFPTKYATYAKTVLSAALFAPLVPSILPVVIVGFIGSYWVEKYNMLRRNSRGPALGPDLSVQFMEILEYALIIFAVAALFFQTYITETGGTLNYLAAIIGIANALLPMDWINKKIFPTDPEKIGNELHSQVHLDFLEDYDRSNPATEEVALEEFSKIRQRKSNQ